MRICVGDCLTLCYFSGEIRQVRETVGETRTIGGMEGHPLLTIQETAGLLRIGRSLAYELAALDQLPVPTVKVGARRFVRRVDLDSFLTAPRSAA